MGFHVPNFSQILFCKLFPKFGLEHCFSFPFPIPKVGNWIFHSHSKSQNLLVGYLIPNPNLKSLELDFSFPLPIPKLVSWIFHSQSQKLGISLTISSSQSQMMCKSHSCSCLVYTLITRLIVLLLQCGGFFLTFSLNRPRVAEKKDLGGIF